MRPCGGLDGAADQVRENTTEAPDGVGRHASTPLAWLRRTASSVRATLSPFERQQGLEDMAVGLAGRSPDSRASRTAVAI